MFGWLKGKPQPAPSDEPLVPTPIPALIQILAHKERVKGDVLTEDEVNEVRTRAVCMMLPLSEASKLAEARGYSDIDPEFVWEQWQEVRSKIVFDDDS